MRSHDIQKILLISIYGPEEVRAGRIKVRRCARCTRTWGEVRLLPGGVRFDPAWDEIELVLLEKGQSRSGLHFCQVLNSAYALPTRPIDKEAARELVMCARRFRILPEILADIRDGFHHIARFTCDLPYKHIARLMASGLLDLNDEEAEEVEECGTCFRERARTSPDFQQGNLFAVKDQYPRLRRYGGGVAMENSVARFFNHTIEIRGDGEVLTRGDLASAYIWFGGEVKISSPDHPGEDLVIPLGRGEVLNMYHPFPRYGFD